MLKIDLFAKQSSLISDIIEVSDAFNIDGFLVMMDIEMAFDSSNYFFLLATLKKFGFGTSFNKSKSCVINKGKTTQYVQLNIGDRQGDPVSGYLFILVNGYLNYSNKE